MRRRFLTWGAAMVLAWGVSAASDAKAQGKGKGAESADAAGKKDEAKRLYKEAEEKWSKLDYAGALPLYQQADSVWPGAQPKYKIAQCLDKLGKIPDAAKAYEAFLGATPDPVKFQDKILDAHTRLGELKKSPAKVTVTTTPAIVPGLRISLDGTPMIGKELLIPPGQHKLEVVGDGFEPSVTELRLSFGETSALAVALKPVATPIVPVVTAPPAAATPAPGPAPAETSEPSSSNAKLYGYITLGIAGAGVVGGTIFGIQALRARGDFNDSPTTDNADKAERNALIADMALGVALTFGITGGVLLWTSSSSTPAEPAPAPKTAIVPLVSPTTGGAAAIMTF